MNEQLPKCLRKYKLRYAQTTNNLTTVRIKSYFSRSLSTFLLLSTCYPSLIHFSALGSAHDLYLHEYHGVIYSDHLCFFGVFCVTWLSKNVFFSKKERRVFSYKSEDSNLTKNNFSKAPDPPKIFLKKLYHCQKQFYLTICGKRKMNLNNFFWFRGYFCFTKLKKILTSV